MVTIQEKGLLLVVTDGLLLKNIKLILILFIYIFIMNICKNNNNKNINLLMIKIEKTKNNNFFWTPDFIEKWYKATAVSVLERSITEFYAAFMNLEVKKQYRKEGVHVISLQAYATLWNEDAMNLLIIVDWLHRLEKFKF